MTRLSEAATSWARHGRALFVRLYRPEFELAHGGVGEELAAARIELERDEWVWLVWDVPATQHRSGKVPHEGRSFGGLSKAKEEADRALRALLSGGEVCRG